jgi:hypothetical protein
MGEIYRDVGEFEPATEALEQALAIVNKRGDWDAVSRTAHGLGDLALDQREPALAASRYRQALKAAVDLGSDYGKLMCLAGLACVAALRGETHLAGRLWATADQATSHLEAPMLASDRQRYERILTPLTEDQRFQEGQQAGRELPLDQVVRDVMLA